jgi:hypothetical protein
MYIFKSEAGVAQLGYFQSNGQYKCRGLKAMWNELFHSLGGKNIKTPLTWIF